MIGEGNLIPPAVFCPKCAKSMLLKEMRNPLEIVKLVETGYSQGAEGQCECGVYLVFLTKPVPANPTFTILFNVYKKGG